MTGASRKRGRINQNPWLAAALAVFAGAAAAAPDSPVKAPEVFAPGVLSGPLHDSSPAFDPKREDVYFARSVDGLAAILVAHRQGETWSTPQVAPFSGEWTDMEPAFSPDGRFLVFVSNRPVTPGGKPLDGTYDGKTRPGQGGNLWRVARKGDSWGAPEHLPASVNPSDTVFAPAVAEDGSLYFMQATGNKGRFRLYRSQYANGTYATAEPLPFSTGEFGDVDPAVAPDESFLVFSSSRPPARGMDLFLVKRTGGAWGEPRHLGETINSEGSDAEARLGLDRGILYFSSERRVTLPLPHTRALTVTELDRAAAWDNGLYNLWQADIRRWIIPGSNP